MARASARQALLGFSPEALFVLSGISQNVGSTLAKSIFDEARPATVAWVRVAFAALVLTALTRRGVRPSWTRRDLAASALFGIAIAAMNLSFYLGIERIDFGKGVTIEFLGPIAVAALTLRTRRNLLAVGFALAGVALLSGLELDGDPGGIAFVLLASSMWAAYILVGTRVARQERGVAGLAVGLVVGAVALTPFGVPGSAHVFGSVHLLLTCCLVGLFASVIGYGIDQHVMQRIAPNRFALLLALLPVTAVFFGFVALDERPGALDALGIALVITGVAYQQRDAAPRPVEEPVL
jgi:inner membrane transporter RhtA